MSKQTHEDYSLFELADCSLYRVPPIDVSSVIDVDTYIAKGFENGENLNNIVDSIMISSVDPLVDKIAKNLLFQRGKKISEVETKTSVELEIHKKNLDQDITEIEQTLGKTAREHKKSYVESQKVLLAKKQYTSAEEQRIAELRKNVKAKMKTLGGKRGYQALLRIHEATIKQQSEDIDDRYNTPSYSGVDYDTEIAKKKAKRSRKERRQDLLKKHSLLEDSITDTYAHSHKPDYDKLLVSPIGDAEDIRYKKRRWFPRRKNKVLPEDATVDHYLKHATDPVEYKERKVKYGFWAKTKKILNTPVKDILFYEIKFRR